LYAPAPAHQPATVGACRALPLGRGRPRPLRRRHRLYRRDTWQLL